MRILPRKNGSLNSGSFVFMHTPMLEFLAAPHFGYELTAWTVNGNAITSGIEQQSEEKQLLQAERSDYCKSDRRCYGSRDSAVRLHPVR